MNKKQMKYENPLRLKELNPMVTLTRIGLQDNQVLCDIGAGSGIFTIPAAKITKNKVFALEINDEMLALIGEKAKNENIENIELIHVQENKFDLEDNSVDIVLMVTVLHEIENPKIFLKEIKRVVKENGKVAIIEFFKRETPMGPSVDHRMEKEEVIRLLYTIGMEVYEEFVLGDNFYCVVFQEKVS